MTNDVVFLSTDKLRYIASRMGRGFAKGRVDRVPVAMTYRQQMSRVENYREAMRFAHAQLGYGQTIDDCRDGIWRHVCVEVDLMMTGPKGAE
jgi:hypothetical protein